MGGGERESEGEAGAARLFSGRLGYGVGVDDVYDVSQVPVSPSRVPSRVHACGERTVFRPDLAATEWQRFTPRSDHNGRRSGEGYQAHIIAA